MFNYLTSFGASSAFQKNRLIATNKNLEAPEEQILKKILKTFQGDDQETRSQIAFATIIKKINTSDSNDSWIYLLKNIIILDRVIDEMLFIDEISELSLQVIEGYFETNAHYAPLRTADMVKNYWKLIKEVARLLATKKHILYFPRSQRSQFLETLDVKEMLRQIESIQNCFKLCFNLINSIESKQGLNEATIKALVGLQKSKLIIYIKIQILYKLISYYSSQMLCTNRFVTLLSNDQKMDLISVDTVRLFKQYLQKFKANSNLIIEFVERNKELKGFEVINYRDFDPMPGNNLLKSIDKIILQRLNFDDNSQNVQKYIGSTPLMLQIRPNPNQDHVLYLQPRKIIQAIRDKKSLNTPFINYKPGFSEDFPQKQIMTVDLIMALKKQKQGKQRLSTYDDIIAYNEREKCVLYAQIPDHLIFTQPKPPEYFAKNNNLYSGLEPIWNFE